MGDFDFDDMELRILMHDILGDGPTVGGIVSVGAKDDSLEKSLKTFFKIMEKVDKKRPTGRRAAIEAQKARKAAENE
jgi:hypothetical protein